MKKNSGKSPHRLIGMKKMRRESQGALHFPHLFFVESQGGLDSEGAAGEVPPTKVWQRSGMGQPSKGDSEGHPWVEENLERQQIPISHTINSGACRYLIFYRVTAEQNKGISVLLLINTAPRVWEIKQPPPRQGWNLFF